jgi:hypothetical protein
MMDNLRKRSTTILILITVVAFIFILLLVSKQKRSELVKPGPVKAELVTSVPVEPKRKIPYLNIQGLYVGMSMDEVRQHLKQKGVTKYETGFSDLFVYAPIPDAEIQITFTCSSGGFIVRRVELSRQFAVEETETAVIKFKEHLASKYGKPVHAEAQSEDLDLCWGTCGQGGEGTRLKATIVRSDDRTRRLVLKLDNSSLVKTCKVLRTKKINHWLYRWISGVQQFKTGMSMRHASAVYTSWYGEELIAGEVRDDAVPEVPVMVSLARDYELFTALDSDALAFEGKGPGSILLKFTGDQAGKDSKLNKRLFYASFSTTAFSSEHLFSDVRRKLDRFIKKYGIPDRIEQMPDGLTATWSNGTLRRSVSILDSGLLTFVEQDPSIIETYRKTVIKKHEDYNVTRFDKNIF